ncbi:Blp family class II bacteriocin [Staphylococcus equorum]|uniref:Blp family class II bacteriocin n=1 Tax=Staphylococcus equorum TaxID=246432 RepID=UPI003EBDFF33
MEKLNYDEKKSIVGGSSVAKCAVSTGAGAAGGAFYGSALGPLGTAGGAIVGGLVTALPSGACDK